MKAKPEDDVNMEPVGFRITRIMTDYAQKLPGHWLKAVIGEILGHNRLIEILVFASPADYMLTSSSRFFLFIKLRYTL